MRTLLLERHAEETAMALMLDRQLMDYRVVREEGVNAEAVYLGRVRQNVRGMGAAFVSLPDGQVGFLPESEARQPLRPGDFVLVQVKKPPVGTKADYLTQDISLAGKGLILLPLSGQTGVSSRVEEEAQRETLRAMAERLRPEHMGLVMRRQSLGADEDALRAEPDLLLARWDTLRQAAEHPVQPRLLWPGRSALEQAMEDFGSVDRLVMNTDIPGAPPHELSSNPFADCAVMEQRERLLKRQVWLPSGGFLVVDPTEALTVIDVNTGKSVGKGKEKEQLFRETNLEAAEMIARLLRVRGVGGIVIVDLIDMAGETDRQDVLDRFRTLLRDDPVKCVVHGYTSLGLLELTRKKR